jgi:hypothetical protein
MSYCVMEELLGSKLIRKKKFLQHELWKTTCCINLPLPTPSIHSNVKISVRREHPMLYSLLLDQQCKAHHFRRLQCRLFFGISRVAIVSIIVLFAVVDNRVLMMT